MSTPNTNALKNYPNPAAPEPISNQAGASSLPVSANPAAPEPISSNQAGPLPVSANPAAPEPIASNQAGASSQSVSNAGRPSAPIPDESKSSSLDYVYGGLAETPAIPCAVVHSFDDLFEAASELYARLLMARQFTNVDVFNGYKIRDMLGRISQFDSKQKRIEEQLAEVKREAKHLLNKDFKKQLDNAALIHKRLSGLLPKLNNAVRMANPRPIGMSTADHIELVRGKVRKMMVRLQRKAVETYDGHCKESKLKLPKVDLPPVPPPKKRKIDREEPLVAPSSSSTPIRHDNVASSSSGSDTASESGSNAVARELGHIDLTGDAGNDAADMEE